jgi:hypothetical protein
MHRNTKILKEILFSKHSKVKECQSVTVQEIHSVLALFILMHIIQSAGSNAHFWLLLTWTDLKAPADFSIH